MKGEERNAFTARRQKGEDGSSPPSFLFPQPSPHPTLPNILYDPLIMIKQCETVRGERRGRGGEDVRVKRNAPQLTKSRLQHCAACNPSVNMKE